MVTVGMNYTVLEGKEAPFEQKCGLVIQALNQTPGHQRTRLLKDRFNPLSYIIISEWSERADFDAFISSPAFRKVTDWGKEAILAARPSHNVYETTAETMSSAMR